jgi:putative cell wall-binding protein
LNNKIRKILTSICFLICCFFIRGGLAHAEAVEHRVYGSDRIQTAVRISQTGWVSADTVILARADNPADALSSASLSGTMDAPILLTYPNSLDQSVIDEIQRLHASTVYILGGEEAVSKSVADKLSGLGLNVKRLGGSTRFETASLINNEAKTSLSSKAIVVSGYATADALSAASNSANNHIPIYLSTVTSIPVSLPANVKEVTIYGGTGVVGTQVESLLVKKGIKVTRIAGSNRYDTNIKAADSNLNENVILVRGTSVNAKVEDYPDAVAGAALSEKLKANIILSDPKTTIPLISEHFKKQRYKDMYVLGGFSAVMEEVAFHYATVPDSTIVKTLDFTPTSSVIDPEKPIVYMINNSDNTIHSYNYQTKEEKTLKLSGKPERLYVRNNKIYITIVVKPHDTYWDEAFQSGGIDIVDAASFKLVKSFHIYMDPFDIAVDNNNIIYVSGGSGQATHLVSYNSETGGKISSYVLYQMNNIELSPDQTKMYVVDTSNFVSPKSMNYYPINEGKIMGPHYPEMNRYQVGRLIKMSPDGHYLFNNSGDYYNDNLDHEGKLSEFTDISFDLPHNRFFVAWGPGGVIYEDDYTTFQQKNLYLTHGVIVQTFYQNGQLIILSRDVNQKTEIETLTL